MFKKTIDGRGEKIIIELGDDVEDVHYDVSYIVLELFRDLLEWGHDLKTIEEAVREALEIVRFENSR